MEQVKELTDLSHKEFFAKDFSKQDLKGVEMHHSKFWNCIFRESDISGNDCSHSDFSGSDLTDVRCNSTNFAHSKLNCRFYPKDAYGITLTLECKTFKGMVVSKLWWLCWVYFAMLMVPEKDEGTNLLDLLISALGSKRYIALKKLFDARQM